MPNIPPEVLKWFPTSAAEDAVDPAVESPLKEVVLEIDDPDPLRLVDVEDDPLPKLENPSFAGRDSSGKSCSGIGMCMDQ